MKATNKIQSARFATADEMIKELDNIEFVTRIVGNSSLHGWDPNTGNDGKTPDKDSAGTDSQEDTGKKKNKKKMILLFSIVALLLIAGFVAAGFATGILGGSSVEVPDLRGMTLEKAEAALNKVDLKIAEGDLVFSSKYDLGEVVSSNPANGSQVKRNSTVVVNICKGAEAGTVPNLVGKKLSEAKDLIEKYGFKLGNVETEVSSEPKDTVTAQSPEGGDETTPGDYINVTVSDGTGKEEVAVPYLIGKDVEVAKQLIKDAGFVVGEVAYGDSNEYDLGQVIKQQYDSGFMLAKGSSIDIKVCGGSGPSVISFDISYDDAKSEVFYLTVVVSDSDGTRTPISREQRHKSDGSGTVEVEGVGTGTVTVLFDDVVVLTKKVEF